MSIVAELNRAVDCNLKLSLRQRRIMIGGGGGGGGGRGWLVFSCGDKFCRRVHVVYVIHYV